MREMFPLTICARFMLSYLKSAALLLLLLFSFVFILPSVCLDLVGRTLAVYFVSGAVVSQSQLSNACSYCSRYSCTTPALKKSVFLLFCFVLFFNQHSELALLPSEPRMLPSQNPSVFRAYRLRTVLMNSYGNENGSMLSFCSR